MHRGFRSGIGVDGLDGGRDVRSIGRRFLDVVLLALKDVIVGQYIRKLGSGNGGFIVGIKMLKYNFVGMKFYYAFSKISVVGEADSDFCIMLEP